MSTEVFFILSLHSIAAVVMLITTFRAGLGLMPSFRWGGMGFITGILGLITRARMDRHHLLYTHVLQDALPNFGMEAFAFYGLPRVLKF
jgi:hypothetical protein